MRDFQSDNRSRDRRDSPRRNFGGRDTRRALMHDAVCDECGKDCKVPFRPSGEKPIYCSDCFDKKGGRDNNRSGRRDFPKRSFGGGDRSISQLTEKIEILNTKLDTIIDLLSSTKKKKSKVVKVVKVKTEKKKKSEATKK